MSDVMGSLAQTDEYDPNAVDWSRMNQPFGILKDTNPIEYGTASPLVNIRTQDIADATDKAMAFSGGGLSTKGIKAYHSSPHDFDRFDLSKIGTGEGAQVYGHGLYFAENPAVSGQGGQYWQQFLRRFPDEEQRLAEMLKYNQFDRSKAGAVIQKEIDDYTSRIAPGGVFDKPHMAQAQDRTRKYIDDLMKERERFTSGQPVGPRTYEVNINADPAHFLDWEKSVGEQGPAVRGLITNDASKLQERLNQVENEKALLSLDRLQPSNIMRDEKGWHQLARESEALQHQLRGVVTEDLPGQLAYRRMQEAAIRSGRAEPATVKAAQVSAAMNEAGIPGIRYLDQGSRGLNPAGVALIERDLAMARAAGNVDKAGVLERELSKLKPSSNYVVFDPNIIDIRKKYAVPGALGAGGMGALAAQDQYNNGGM